MKIDEPCGDEYAEESWWILPSHLVQILDREGRLTSYLDGHATWMELLDGARLAYRLDDGVKPAEFLRLLWDLPGQKEIEERTTMLAIAAMVGGVPTASVKRSTSPSMMAIPRLSLWSHLARLPEGTEQYDQGVRTDTLQLTQDQDESRTVVFAGPDLRDPLTRLGWGASVGANFQVPFSPGEFRLWACPKKRLSKEHSRVLISVVERWYELTRSEDSRLGQVASIESCMADLHPDARTNTTYDGLLKDKMPELEKLRLLWMGTRGGMAKHGPALKALEAEVQELKQEHPEWVRHELGDRGKPVSGLHVKVTLGSAGQECVHALTAMLMTYCETVAPLRWVVFGP